MKRYPHAKRNVFNFDSTTTNVLVMNSVICMRKTSCDRKNYLYCAVSAMYNLIRIQR